MSSLFLESGFWRDFVASTSTLATLEGREEILAMLAATPHAFLAHEWRAEGPGDRSEDFIGPGGALVPRGNLAQSRFYSLFLALQLKARQAGLPVQVYGQPAAAQPATWATATV